MEEKTLGQRCIEYRKKHCISQNKFAEMCDLSVSTVYNLEHERFSPSLIVRGRIERVINKDEIEAADAN